MFREESPKPLANTRDLREYLAHQIDLAGQLFARDNEAQSAISVQNVEEAAMRNWIDQGYAKRFHDEVSRREKNGESWPTLEDIDASNESDEKSQKVA